MDVLNEVENLFKKLEAVPADIKEAAFKRIVEKLSSAEGKRKSELATTRKRSCRRRKKGEKYDQRVDSDKRYIVESVLTSRGRKAQRICYTQVKNENNSDVQNISSDSTQDESSEGLCGVNNFLEDTCGTSNEDLVIDEKSGLTDINETPEPFLENSPEVEAKQHSFKVKAFEGDSKAESSSEESQLVIVDPPDILDSKKENKKNVMKPTLICDVVSSDEESHRSFGDSFTHGEKKVEKAAETLRESFCEEERETFTCKDCSFQTENKILFRSHQRKHVGLRPHKCHDCGKTFPQLSALKIHMKRHRGQRDFPCDYGCNYRAYTKGEKLRHMTLHTGERCYQCQYCGKQFAKDSTLREHVQSIHERSNKHICATCGFSTFRANNLRVHICMRHRGEYNNHVCPVCGAKVKQRTAFLDHMRSHSGERPYKCPICESSFTCIARLTVHRKSVHGPRDFLCKHCQKCFQTKHHLERHELIHTNQKPYACPFCSYSCNTQGNVTKHVKGVHNKPDFSYRKYKAEQLIEADCKALKLEWIEKGEKLTDEYLRDLSKKLGREVTLLELKKREAEKNKRLFDDVEQLKKRRSRKQEHDYHSKICPEHEDRLEEEEADEPTAVLLNVSQSLPNSASDTVVDGTVPSLPQAHLLNNGAVNRNSNTQPTIFLQRDAEISHLQSVLSDKVQKDNNPITPLLSGQNIQFSMNEQMPLEDQIPLHVIYHPSPPQSSNNNSQGNVGTNSNSPKYINNINVVEVKGDSQTVVFIINTDSP